MVPEHFRGDIRFDSNQTADFYFEHKNARRRRARFLCLYRKFSIVASHDDFRAML